MSISCLASHGSTQYAEINGVRLYQRSAQEFRGFDGFAVCHTFEF